MTALSENQQGELTRAELPSDRRDCSSPSQPRLVVGIGAAAGGAPALRQLFAHMPADTGMAFVVMVHLPPRQGSKLATVLQDSTALPVIPVTAALPLAPNHIYVVPPTRRLTIADDHLQPRAPESRSAQRAPIDWLFRTLAETYGPRAAGIILSGSGSNGTLGLARIKECGGLTLAQDPQDAEYDAMPRSAIAAGLVDRVAPASQLPQTLIAYMRHAGALERSMPPGAVAPPQENDADSLYAIATLLSTRTGFNCSVYQRPFLMRRIAHRMQVIGAADLASYAEQLPALPGEPEAILHDLMLRPSGFSRDPAAISALESDVMPKLFAGKSFGDTIRAWVPDCANGEEAYTVAMVLREFAARHKARPAIQIFATDVDQQAITTARIGRYPKAIAAEMTPARLRRFFAREPEHYRVTKELRRMVIFARHNLATDPPFARLDLIACRNVLGDLTPAVRERVLGSLHYALRPDGYLWLGAAADWVGEGGLFAARDEAHGLFVPRAVRRYVPLPLTSARRTEAAPPAQDERSAPVRSLHQRLLEPYTPPSALLTSLYDIVHLSAGADRFLRFTAGQPSANLLDVALPELRLALRPLLDQARRSGSFAAAPGVAVAIDGATERVNLVVQPVQSPEWARGYLLVLFDQIHDIDAGDAPAAATALQRLADRLAEMRQNVQRQLQRAAEQPTLESAELQAANQELQTSNEELRARAADLVATRATLEAEIAERRRIELELTRGARQQAAIAALSRRALAKSDLDRFLNDAAAVVARTLNVEYCAVLERLHDRQALRVRAGFGWRAGVVGQLTVNAEPDTQAGYTLASGAPVFVADLRAETRFQAPPVLLDHGVVSSVSVVIVDDHGPFGVLGAHTTRQHTFSTDEIEFLQAIANLLAAAIARQRLEAARQQLLLRFDNVREEEQRQLARELHDQLGQYLTGLRLNLTLLGDAAPLPPAAAAHLERVRGIVEQIGNEVRHLALALRPISLDEQGLLATLKNYVADWSRQTQVTVDLHSRGLGKLRLPPQLETTIYRVVQEALTNVLRHAQARSVSLILERRADHVQVVVEDDGRGFDVETLLASPNVERRLGLLGMQERAAMVGGQLTIESSNGRGTSVFLRVPYAQEGVGGGDD